MRVDWSDMNFDYTHKSEIRSKTRILHIETHLSNTIDDTIPSRNCRNPPPLNQPRMDNSRNATIQRELAIVTESSWRSWCSRGGGWCISPPSKANATFGFDGSFVAHRMHFLMRFAFQNALSIGGDWRVGIDGICWGFVVWFVGMLDGFVVLLECEEFLCIGSFWWSWVGFGWF